MTDNCVNELTLHGSQELGNFKVIGSVNSATSGRIRPFCSQGVKFQNRRFIDLELTS